MRVGDLKSERAFIENAINTMKDIFIVFDLEGNFVVWNTMANEVTGYSDEEIASKRPTDFFRDEDAKRVAETIARGLVRGFARVEAELKVKDGSSLSYEFYGTPLRDEEGNPVAVTAIGRDITERKRLAAREMEMASIRASREAAEENARAMGEIMEVAAKELRRPASMLKRDSSLVLARMEDIEDEEIREAIRSIDEGASNLAYLVNKLAEVSRIEKNGVQLRYSRVDPRTLAFRAVEEIRAREEERDFELVRAEGEWTVVVDQEKIKDCLLLLLDNASKFSAAGSPVESGYLNDEGETVFWVADRGPGIPERHRQGVFDRFYQLRQETRAGESGLGLGLYIARRYVEAHRGWIGVEARGGGGSIFRFGVPDHPPPEDFEQ